jgi:hypothetical protein
MARSDRRVMLGSLVLFGAVLFATSIPGVFTIDENNYMASLLALQQGGVHLRNTEGLPSSWELAYFDPVVQPGAAPPPAMPIATTAPPLYAPLALAFSFAGFRGLIALNVLSLLLTAWLAGQLAFRLAGGSRVAAFAAAYLVCFGGYSIEYAQGVWPHMLSMLLTFAAYGFVVRALEAPRLSLPGLAGLAGLCVGLASGVRYQNAVWGAALALGLLLLGDEGVPWRITLRARAARLAAYVGGALPALLASGLINAARTGSANPFTKSRGYLRGTGTPGIDGWLEVLQAGWARFVDHSVHGPPKEGAEAFVRYTHEYGAMVVGGVVKKAWLQSMPWAVVALAVMAVTLRRGASSVSQARAFRSAAMIFAATLAVFALTGFSKFDGYCFNQRYLLELLPLMSVALAVGMAAERPRPTALLAGFALALVLLMLLPGPAPYEPFTLWLELRGPLLLAALCLAAHVWPRGALRGWLLGVTLGMGLGWSLGIHLREDLPASRELRLGHLAELERARQVLPAANAALFTYWGTGDAYGPLALERDLIIADTHRDAAASAGALRARLFAQGRRVFMLAALPPEHQRAVLGSHRLRAVLDPSGQPFMAEILP